MKKSEIKKQFWLMKSEPSVYSIENLQLDQKTWWEGVRNFQARNFMTTQMHIGDEVLFYHSNAKPSGIAGLAVISSTAQPDKTQFDKKSQYYDSRATAAKPIWFGIEIKFQKKFKNILSLEYLRAQNNLTEMLLFQKGQRLSILPVSESHFLQILKLI